MTDHTVFVLGAGASLGEAMGHRPKQSREYPPLDINFFQRAKRYRYGPLLESVEAVAASQGEPDLTSSSKPVSLEAYLGRLYFNINFNPIAAATSAYFDAVDLYAREVIATTQWMSGRKGLLYKMIKREVDRGRKVTIVTFNIDMLAESALDLLSSNSRSGFEWSVGTGYGFRSPIDPVTAGGDEYPVRGATSDVLLLKMHGSVNWVFQTRDYYPPPDLVSKTRKFFVITDRELSQGRSTISSARGGRPWYLFPLLVPPIYEKHSFIRMHLQDVWDAASAALRDANRVVLYGYSFPQADMHARHFFQQESMSNAALRAPELINPDPRAEAALWDVLRPSRCVHYRTADAYLADQI